MKYLAAFVLLMAGLQAEQTPSYKIFTFEEASVQSEEIALSTEELPNTFEMVEVVEVAEKVAPPPPAPKVVNKLQQRPPLKKEVALVVPMQENHLVPPKEVSAPSAQVDLKHVFGGAPIIYSLLLFMSIGSVFVWAYSQFRLKYAGSTPDSVLTSIRDRLNSNQFDEALKVCKDNDSLFTRMIASGISSRTLGTQIMVETMKEEGKRATVNFWQRISLLNDIAVIAPMIGLLGTVLGMFYAFYDLNRSIENIGTLFDGLGISVGTTVAGLFVAIIAMILYTTAKYRLIRRLAYVENQAQTYVSLIEKRY